MALKITDDCINCDMCTPECPNNAITMGLEIFEIDRVRCTECVGHHSEPQCIEVCPVDCIISDPGCSENRIALLQKYQRLAADNSEHEQLPVWESA
ncbi:MAG: YfhL family 4Fe-4S dicluster ferredoxin [Gammaproteobacteria bacterium]